MALVILRRLMQNHRQLTGILKLQAKHLRHSVVFGKENISSNIKENLLPEDVRQKWLEEFMANLDKSPIYLKRKEAIELMIEEWRYQNVLLPEVIKEEHWYLLLTESYTEKPALAYLQFLANLEEIVKKRKVKQEEKMLNKEKKPEVEGYYPEFSMHIITRDREEIRWNRLKGWKSDIPIVVDLHFPNISVRSQVDASKQLERLFSDNIKHVQPLQVHMTSVRDNIRMMSHYESSNSLPLFFHEDHFMELFPHEKLIYLSKDAPPLRTFDKDKIYIIGGLCDRPLRPRITSSLAKTYGIACRSLPLDDHVKLSNSTRKDLYIDVVFNIIQNMYLHHSWQRAFEIGLNYSSKFKVLSEHEKRQIPKKKIYSRHSSDGQFWRH